MARHYSADLKGLWFVGDSKGDLQAALAVDAQPVLVLTGKGRKTMNGEVPTGTLIFDDLAAVAAELIHTSASLNN
ncbi:D,D-heptose 1,7-bisphosphate phosphatase [Pseudomonas syringae pv. actinidiae ICMP 19096]|uniref:D,D-heptose 1,7-bisphosphate phosphatase n=1 Tax=Pseudomonas syringae pv. actinidiae ICMP 19096 TaxID=1194405 RepID=A0A656JN64_PSESF|nr:D,D-heptose 1,7-bisphosphate phosphatase [Pseudomonas syringae pv. actinidiae ICMP 19096]